MSHSAFRSIITAFCLLPLPALADQVFNESVIINGSSKLCVGASCSDGETFSFSEEIKLSGGRNEIVFNDTSSSSFPDRDWMLQANNSLSEHFSLRDLTSGGTPFSVEGGAPSNSVYVGSNGRVGFGTSLPERDLHIVSNNQAGIRLENSGGMPGTWDVLGTGAGFSVREDLTSRTPLYIETEAPSGSLYVESNGWVGLGGASPDGKLHTRGAGHQIMYFESLDENAVQIRFRTDSENRRFLAVDANDNVRTQMQFRDNSIVFMGQTAAQEWLNVSAAGITTAGPSCNPNPCDATFDPEAFVIPPIDERASLMWERRHLPAIGPTTPEEPMNLTEKTGGIIHELEVAHIYIEQLHARLEAQEAQNADQNAQIEALFVKFSSIE